MRGKISGVLKSTTAITELMYQKSQNFIMTMWIGGYLSKQVINMTKTVKQYSSSTCNMVFSKLRGKVDFSTYLDRLNI